jgi:cobalt-zinc-cadmium efflux system protein
VSAVGLLFLFGGCASTAQACDWPDVEPVGWSLVQGTGFTLRVPPAYQYTYGADLDSEVRLWRAGERTLKYDWGDRSVVTGGRRIRWEGDVDWQLCEVTVGGYPARVVTYQTPKDYFVVEAFWAELPSADWQAERIRPALWIVFGLTSTYFFVEVVGGLLTNSLALLADAAHMLTDVGGLGLALFAAWMSSKPATPAKTYGYYRVEILAALANAVVLFLVAFFILYEAFRRFQEPPEVASLPMMGIAVVGLAVNVVGIWLLRRAAKESLNMQGAFLEVVSDLLGSVGVIAAAGVMWATGWWYADPIFSVLIGLVILPRTWRLMKQAVNVLLEGTPAHLNLADVEQAMLAVEGAAAVHDLHIWTITSGVDALSAHVVLDPAIEPVSADTLVERMAAVVKERFGIGHTTIQVERTDRGPGETRF